MKNLQHRFSTFALLPFLAAFPAAAPAFDAIDTIPWPSEGRFPAYAPEPGRPTHVYVEAGVRHDDNVLRTETNAQSDTIARFGGGIRHEQRIIGRQRLRLEARGDYYKYNQLSDLDHWAYALGGDWLWEIGNNLAGTVSAGYLQRQADLAETQANRLDLVRAATAEATAGYLITPGLRLRGGLAGAQEKRTQATEKEARYTSATAGLDYVSPLANTIGLEYRTTLGEAAKDVGSVVNSDYQEHEAALVSTYALGSQLRAGIRLGYTWRKYDEQSQLDFDGATGRVSVEWLPGTKTVLGFEAYREPRSVVEADASHVIVAGVAFGPRWALTNKVVLAARFVAERRRYEGSSTVATATPERDERIHLIRFSLGWEPVRFWQAGVAFDHGNRESNFVGRDYDFNAVMANLAYVW